jgi:hypothetical protein
METRTDLSNHVSTDFFVLVGTGKEFKEKKHNIEAFVSVGF